ncbi:MAG: CsgG/HfaB family protein [Azoarcus sp.]|nr:CsgG/HfaB family protein [Azoarcus sp.]
MGSPLNKLLSLSGAFAVLLVAGGCASMQMGSESAKTTATGSAGGANAQGENSALEKCAKPLGTMAIVEDVNSSWYRTLSSDYKLGSTSPVLKLLAQQSNCFVVVERGRAMGSMMRERELAESGELRQESSFGKGQMVSADYTMNPSLTFSGRDSGGIGGKVGSFFGNKTLSYLGLGANAKFSEASTLLTLIDNRSGVQLAAAEGSARNIDFGLLSSFFGGSTGGSLGGYSKTAEGKVIVAALTDSFNNLVKAVRNYKMQTIEGGMGTGRGGLQVQPK